jgi:hypothetical protein
MELHSIDTLSEGWITDEGPRVLLVTVAVAGTVRPQEVLKFASQCLEAWGEEPLSAKLYSYQPDDIDPQGPVLVGISCEV